MIRIMWELLGSMVVYGIITDLLALMFARWEPVVCTMAGALVILPGLVWFLSDRTECAGRENRLKGRDALLCVFWGIAACLAANTLIKASGVSGLFPGYSRLAEDLYAPPVGLQICAMGAVIPLAEELIFRGLGFCRLRSHTGFAQAALLSSALFGLWHGNVLQGIYGFSMGMLLAWVMERKKNLLAPVLMHMAANLTSVAVSAALRP